MCLKPFLLLWSLGHPWLRNHNDYVTRDDQGFKVTLFIPVSKFALQENDSIWHPFNWIKLYFGVLKKALFHVDNVSPQCKWG